MRETEQSPSTFWLMGDPFNRRELESLKSPRLLNLDDVRLYAERLVKIYQTTMRHIDESLQAAYDAANAGVDSFLATHRVGYGQPGGRYDTYYEHNVLSDAEKKVETAQLDANLDRAQVIKELQRELAGDFVDVRTRTKLVILRTPEREYGVDLKDADKGVREAKPIRTPFGVWFYRLGEAPIR